MRAPLTFVYGNCVFATSVSDAWAAFAIEPSSYQWLAEEDKRARFLALLAALEAIEADIQIVRVARSLQGDDQGPSDGPHRPALLAYAEAHERRLQALGAARIELFLLVSLSDPERDVATYASALAERGPSQLWRDLRTALSSRDRRVLRARELERVRVRADQAHARLAEFLPVREARVVELQWLVRRSFCRGVGEPVVDGLHEPRALAFERNGQAVLAPLEGDVLRWGSSIEMP
jgi:hypothetical protein